MMPSSFLHAASAKALTNNSPHNHQRTAATAAGLRLLLIEEDSTPIHPTNDDLGSSSSSSPTTHHPALAYSLATDAACAIVASSNLLCRGGCLVQSSNDEATTFDETNNEKMGQCRCCKVALLIPGETKKSRKRRRKRSNRHDNNGFIDSPMMVQSADKIPFPMNCKPSDNNHHDKKGWEDNVLHQIQVKYIHSYSDMVKYLAYAPSLPNHLQPLDGIFVLGLGELLSRDSGGSSLTEMTHALSLLADTGDALETNRNELSQTSGYSQPASERITLMATIPEHTYKSLPKRMTTHLYQWMDYVALIQSLKSDGMGDEHDNGNNTSWELVVKACTLFDARDYSREKRITSSLFKIVNYYDAEHEICHEIVWNA